jgi:hypothetical protein
VLLKQTPGTTTALVSSVTPALAGQVVTLTAMVTAAVPQTTQPTGLVTFKDGTITLGAGTLNASGQAVLNLSSLGSGYHALTAVYQGDPNLTGSTSPALNQLHSGPIS